VWFTEEMAAEWTVLLRFGVARDAVNMPPGKITSQRRKPAMKMARSYSSICVSLQCL